MLSKLTTIGLVALAPWSQALQLQVPEDWQVSSTVNMSWTNTNTDPPFTLQLVNLETQISYSVANVLDPTADFASFLLRVVPQGIYNLRAVNITNTIEVFNETPTFSIRTPPGGNYPPTTTDVESKTGPGQGSPAASTGLPTTSFTHTTTPISHAHASTTESLVSSISPTPTQTQAQTSAQTTTQMTTTDSTSPMPTSLTPSPSRALRLSAGAIVGIVVGAVAIGALLLVSIQTVFGSRGSYPITRTSTR